MTQPIKTDPASGMNHSPTSKSPPIPPTTEIRTASIVKGRLPCLITESSSSFRESSSQPLYLSECKTRDGLFFQHHIAGGINRLAADTPLEEAPFFEPLLTTLRERCSNTSTKIQSSIAFSESEEKTDSPRRERPLPPKQDTPTRLGGIYFRKWGQDLKNISKDLSRLQEVMKTRPDAVQRSLQPHLDRLMLSLQTLQIYFTLQNKELLLKIERESIPSLIGDLCSKYAEEISSGRLHITSSATSDATCYSIDKERTLFILHVLLSNAFRYGSSDPITLHIDHTDTDHLHCTVTSYGPLLESKYLENVLAGTTLTRYFPSRDFQSGGLKIFTCKQLVEYMEGTFAVLSRSLGDRNATTFSLSLPHYTAKPKEIKKEVKTTPLVPEDSEHALVLSSSSSEPRPVVRQRRAGIFFEADKRAPLATVTYVKDGEECSFQMLAAVLSSIPQVLKEKPLLTADTPILIVDDESITTKLFQRALQHQKHTRIDIAANGQEAVDMCKTTHYPLIFMDIQMPVKDGLQATREIRDFEKVLGRAPSVIVAITSNTLDKERYMSAGMVDTFFKPFDMRNLSKLLEKHFTLVPPATEKV